MTKGAERIIKSLAYGIEKTMGLRKMKTALLLIYMTPKRVNMAKKQNRQNVYLLRDRPANVGGKKGQDPNRTDFLDVMSHLPEAVLGIATFTAQKQC